MEITEKDIEELKNIIDIEKEKNIMIHKIEHNFYTKTGNKEKRNKGTTEYIINEINGKFEPIFVKIPNE